MGDHMVRRASQDDASCGPSELAARVVSCMLWNGENKKHNITSAWAVDREFVNIDWASLGPISPNWDQI